MYCVAYIIVFLFFCFCLVKDHNTLSGLFLVYPGCICVCTEFVSLTRVRFCFVVCFVLASVFRSVHPAQ